MDDFEHDEIVSQLRSLIMKAVPKAQTLTKYGGTLFTLKPEEKEGQFCGIFQYKDHVQLAFSQGALLKDPKKLLEGSGKFRRHVNIRAEQELTAALSKMLKEAAKISNE